jgi:hypothetical protein
MAKGDALVVEQRLGVRRHAVAGEIGRGGDHLGRQGRTDLDAHHVLLDQVPKSDAGVEPAADDIRELAFDGDLQRDLRIGLQEAPEDRLQHDHIARARHIQAQQAGRAASVLDHRLAGRDQLLDRRQHPLQVVGAHFGQADAAGGAVEQGQPQLLFQAADRLADRRGRHPQANGGGGEPPFLGDGDEGDESVELILPHLILLPPRPRRPRRHRGAAGRRHGFERSSQN